MSSTYCLGPFRLEWPLSPMMREVCCSVVILGCLPGVLVAYASRLMDACIVVCSRLNPGGGLPLCGTLPAGFGIRPRSVFTQRRPEAWIRKHCVCVTS